MFQPYHDSDRSASGTGWMAKCVYGRLHEVWAKLVDLQSRGAAIAVTMAETDGQGRRSANMIRPRAVWIEADSALPRALPLPPTIAVETSPGHRHYIYVARDLTWELWHGAQQTLIADYGSDKRAALRTQVLRLPGTLHLKNPADPHLVRIVEELTSERIYTGAEIAAAFPPRPSEPRRRRERVHVTRTLQHGADAGGQTGSDWRPAQILSALLTIEARLQASGPFTAQGDRHNDQAIEVDWARRDWWLRAMAALHHASGGSEEGLRLSCAASGGDNSLGLIGCPAKFDASDQRRVWVSLTAGPIPELRGAAVTIRTIYWIAQRYCGWKAGRRGRPIGQPRPERDISTASQAVADAGRWAVSTGLHRVLAFHIAVVGQRFAKDSLRDRILQEIRRRLYAKTGVTAIGSLTGMASTLGCPTETLRKYLRQLANRWHLIIKNEGNATSMLGTSGIAIALRFPAEFRDAIQAHLEPTLADPPIFEQTGKPIPHFHDKAGRIPSRYPYSHDATDIGASAGRGPQDQRPSLQGQPKPVSGHAEMTLADWIKADVIHAEFGDLLERVAAARGKRGISRVMVCLKGLQALRSSFADVRCDAERAADLAARSLVRKAAKAKGLADADLQRLLDQSSPGGVADEDAPAFVREMARHLEAIIREAKGDPDPWRSARWRGRQQAEMPKPNGNAYAAARGKRDLSNAGSDGNDDPPF